MFAAFVDLLPRIGHALAILFAFHALA